MYWILIRSDATPDIIESNNEPEDGQDFHTCMHFGPYSPQEAVFYGNRIIDFLNKNGEEKTFNELSKCSGNIRKAKERHYLRGF